LNKNNNDVRPNKKAKKKNIEKINVKYEDDEKEDKDSD
jgi:hypothetical protein